MHRVSVLNLENFKFIKSLGKDILSNNKVIGTYNSYNNRDKSGIRVYDPYTYTGYNYNKEIKLLDNPSIFGDSFTIDVDFLKIIKGDLVDTVIGEKYMYVKYHIQIPHIQAKLVVKDFEGSITSINILPSGLIISGTSDSQLIIWNLQTGKIQNTL